MWVKFSGIDRAQVFGQLEFVVDTVDVDVEDRL